MKIIFVFPILVAYGVPFLIFFLSRRRNQAEGKRAPFTSDLLRSPGESLNQQIQELNDEMTINLFSLMFLPFLIFSSLFLFWQQNINLLLGLWILVVFAFKSYFSHKLWKQLKKRRALRLGYDGELAVGQELTQLMLDGYHVYHDFPADKFNIDHIVVGSTGVFAVETKARSKPIDKNKGAAYKVVYDGKSIRFPGYEDQNTLQQADRQVKWLRQWLSSAVGDPIPVRPIVALPGWFVERISPDGMPVLNPKLIRHFLMSQKDNKLSESMIGRIVHQIDQKCRNVEPTTVMLERRNEDRKE